MDLRTWSVGRLIALTISYWVVAALLGGWLFVRWVEADVARYQAEHPGAGDFLTTINPHYGRVAAIALLPPLIVALVWWWLRRSSRPAV